VVACSLIPKLVPSWALESFNVEVMQILLFEEKEGLIIYNDKILEEIGNLINDILLAVACINHFWTGQIGKEKLF
jgi:hypothetical protein